MVSKPSGVTFFCEAKRVSIMAESGEVGDGWWELHELIRGHVAEGVLEIVGIGHFIDIFELAFDGVTHEQGGQQA